MVPHKQGQTVHSEARNIVRRLIRKCDEESRTGALLHLLKQATLRAADYTGLSARTISRIRKEDAQAQEDKPLLSPGKKRPKSIDKKFHCSESDKIIIRKVIYDFYIQNRAVPSGPKLLAAIRAKICFPWKVHSLYRLLRTMGFKWKKCNSIRKVLIEKPSIVERRAKYLRNIEHYRSLNRNIIYVDEIWVDNTLRFTKCYQNDEMLDVMKNTNTYHRLIVIHACGINGFLKGADLIFGAQSVNGDYQDQISAATFEKWVIEKLLPNIPANSVVVMDDAPYHLVLVNKIPSKYAPKKDMTDWLRENEIPYKENMKKYELYDLIERNKRSEKSYKVDEILKANGHSVLRLPQYLAELNPIQLAWAQMRQAITQKDPLALSSSDLQIFTYEAMNEIKSEQWAMFYKHVQKLEKEYWDKDCLIEEIMDDLPIQIQSSSDSDSDSDGSSSSMDF
ncbi:uncharacterized protein LOC143188498 [Calliopsis andreniformis]|uniref:uncharacterized protein LOC143188498 n=1 Tax=Calliopsis andreniformis TaxID=337506 RepID=UPI003FCD3ED6